MTDIELAERLALRARAIDWAAVREDRLQSRVSLMKEYLRRAALWQQRLNGEWDWPFWDIAQRVNPAVRATPEALKLLDDTLAVRSALIADTWMWMLHWAVLRAAGGAADDPPDPFEALLWFYERGGGFYPEKGFIEVDGTLFRRGPVDGYLTQQPFAYLDVRSLDELDARYDADQS
jgi:hypothetical protein